MIAGRIHIQNRPEVVLSHVRKTETVAERTKGLLGGDPLLEGDGLLISPCNSIHTFFMKFPIDVVFLNSTNAVVKIVRTLNPFRFAMSFRASAVLELRAGETTRLGIRAGDILLWEGKQ